MYTIDLLHSYKKKFILSVFFLILFSLIFIISTIVFFIFMTKDNQIAFVVILSIIDVISLVAIILISTHFLNRYHHYYKHIKIITPSSSNQYIVEVTQIKTKLITLANGVRCFEITTKIEDEIKTFYLLDVFDISLFKENEQYKIDVSSSFIKEAKHV